MPEQDRRTGPPDRRDHCPQHEAQVERTRAIETRIEVLETKMEHLETDQNVKHSNEGKNFTVLLTTLITIGLVILGAIGTLHMTKVSEDDFKGHMATHVTDEAKRDAKIDGMYQSQMLFQRELTKEMTEIKVAIASLHNNMAVSTVRYQRNTDTKNAATARD